MKAPTDPYVPPYVCARCMRLSREAVFEALRDGDELKLGETVDEMDSYEFGLIWQLLGSGQKTVMRRLLTKIKGLNWITVKEANE